jgi:fermentation-respiration switch protein FrsA (DUF1100 family)
VKVSTRYATFGHSEGGQTALFVSQIADQWAPELHLVGAAAGAPGAELHQTGLAVQNSLYAPYILLGLMGMNAAYGDKAAPLDAILTAAGKQAVKKANTLCLNDLFTYYKGTPASTFLKFDPYTDPTWSKLFNENDPGKFTKPSPEPLLIFHGTADEQVPVTASKTLFDHLCALHQVEQRWVYPRQSHAGVTEVAVFPDVLSWINHRFAGASAPDPMKPTGEPNVATEQCPTG